MRRAVATLVLALGLCAPNVLAQTRAEVMTSREIARQGLEAYDNGDYETAADKLAQAYAVVKVPDEVKSHNQSVTLSWVGFVGGAVLAATGVTLLATAPRKNAEARHVAPWIGLGSAGVEGRF